MSEDTTLFREADGIAEAHAKRSFFGTLDLASKIRLRSDIYMALVRAKLEERDRCADAALNQSLAGMKIVAGNITTAIKGKT